MDTFEFYLFLAFIITIIVLIALNCIKAFRKGDDFDPDPKSPESIPPPVKEKLEDYKEPTNFQPQRANCKHMYLIKEPKK